MNISRKAYLLPHETCFLCFISKFAGYLHSNLVTCKRERWHFFGLQEIQKYPFLDSVVSNWKTHMDYFFFYCCSSTVVSIFTPPRPLAPPIPTLQPTPFGFICVSFIHVSWWDFLYFPPLFLSPLPSGYYHLFFISKFVVIFCLLVCFID